MTRLGADIGLLCAGCARRILLERAELERRLVAVEPAAHIQQGGIGTAAE